MIDWDSLKAAEATRKDHQRAILESAGLDPDEEMQRIRASIALRPMESPAGPGPMEVEQTTPDNGTEDTP